MVSTRNKFENPDTKLNIKYAKIVNTQPGFWKFAGVNGIAGPVIWLNMRIIPGRKLIFLDSNNLASSWGIVYILI